MRYIRTARLCHSRRPGNRGRLARILGPELPAGTSGTRHAGYVLHRKRPRHPAPYPHQLHSGTHHGDAETAYPGSMPRQGLPQRSHLLPCALHFPPDRGTLYRRRGLLRRHETVASLLRTGVLRPGDENTFETLLLPLHGALGGDGHLLQPLRREGVQRLQTYRMARNHGMRHGGPERTRSMRHRQQ